MSIRWSRQYTFDDWYFRKYIDPNHELVQLANKIDWRSIFKALSVYYSPKGRQALDLQLMVGLHILKHRHDLSDEDAVKILHENIYWMYFCGVYQPAPVEGQQSSPILDSSSLTYFRKRIGPQGMEKLEEVIRDQLYKAHLIHPRTAITDTTAMEKNIAYPTDTDLLYKVRERVVRVVGKIRQMGVKIPGSFRTFRHRARKVLLFAKKFGKDKMERIQKANSELAQMAQKVASKVTRICATINHQSDLSKIIKGKVNRLGQQLADLQHLTHRVIHQNEMRFLGHHVPDKVFSLHEPSVVAIKKGKQAKPTEYGSKVSLTVDRHGFIIAHHQYFSNISDVNTLPDALEGWQKTFGRSPLELGADRGFHHPQTSQEDLGTQGIAKLAIPCKGKRKHPESNTYWFKRLQRLRAIIEAIISHLKNDHRMGRCLYKGPEGDHINVSLATMAWNCKKWIEVEGVLQAAG